MPDYLDTSAFLKLIRSEPESIALLPLDDPTVEAAAGLEPATPRALDAMHLAIAASLGADLGRFSCCCDVRPAGAASAAGLNVRTPG